MYNDIVSIGPVTIHGYGLMIGIGVAVALFLGDYRAKKRGLNGDLIYGLTITTVIMGFVAARLLFIITQWREFLKNPLHFISGSGFVVYGGIIGGVITIFAYCKWKKMDFWNYLDVMIPSVAIAQGFGRIGCFLAGCCYGKETDSIIGVTFTNSVFAPNNMKLLPSQLFMAAGDFLLVGILILYSRKEREKGRVSMLYLMLYSIGRFLVEFTRNDDRGFVGGLSTSQFISIFTLIIGALVFFWLIPAQAKNKAATEQSMGQDV